MSRNEEKFAKATKHFLEEIGPVLSDMGFKIVDAGRGQGSRRRDLVQQEIPPKPSVEVRENILTRYDFCYSLLELQVVIFCLINIDYH